MKIRKFLYFGLIVFSTLLLSSCATTNLRPFGQGINGANLEEDESRFWQRTKEERERLDASGKLYEDEGLRLYINNVLHKILPNAVRNCGLNFETKVINDPRMNAFCFPDGTIYIHTGILARMDNEAQLATVLGHEVTHAIDRHTVKFFRDLKNKTAFYNTFSVTASGVGGAFGQLASVLGSVGVLASIYGYSRDNEREADESGFKMMLNAHYDVREAPKIFKLMQENFDKEEKNEPFFFGTHPRLQERIDSYESLIEDLKKDPSYIGDRVINEKEFAEITHRLVLDNALLDLSMGRVETAKAGIKKYLDYGPGSAKGYYYLAEAYYQQYEQPENKKLKDKQTKEEKKQQAMEYYSKAITLDPTFALPYKSLGLIYLKDKRKTEAVESLNKYLELSPGAADSAYVKNYLKTISDEKY